MSVFPYFQHFAFNDETGSPPQFPFPTREQAIIMRSAFSIRLSTNCLL